MAYLEIIQTGAKPQLLELRSEQMLLGRHPSCQIVVDNQAVSRYHAQILQSHGSYFLEDLRSRNGTYLNGGVIEGRTELQDADEVRICDLTLRFHAQAPQGSAPEKNPVDPQTGSTHVVVPFTEKRTEQQPRKKRPASTQEIKIVPNDSDASLSAEGEDDSTSSILTTLNAGKSQLRLGIKPEAKLRAVLEISKALGKELKLEAGLQKVLDGLFRIFPQSDVGFVVLRDSARKKLSIRATKTRPGIEDPPRPSMTIVRKAMKNGEAILSADAGTDKRFEKSESISNLQIRSMMCAPLIGKSGDPLGVLQINTRDLSQQFNEDDLDVLVWLASQAVLAIEYARMHEEVLVQRDMQRDLEFATQVQLGFLPKERPHCEGYEFADFYEAAQNVGGDYLDYFNLPDDRIAFALGDVAGKGIPAALLMARIFSAARFYFLTRPNVGEAMTGLNAEITASGLGHRFITCVLGVLDPMNHTVTIANAGHMSPIFRKPNGKTETIARTEAGLPIGIQRNQVFKTITRTIEPGETCVLFTDGISESMTAENDIYGTARLEQYIGSATFGAIQELIDGILQSVEDFTQGEPQRDDMCLLGFSRLA